MTSFQLVVFDMAGTTVRDQHEVERCFAQAASQTDLIVSDERILAMQGLSKRFVFETLWAEQLGSPTASELKAKVDHSYRLFTEILENHYRTQAVVPTEGCLETFASLRENGIKIALTTGFYRVVTDIILEKLGWLEGLDENYIGNDQTIIQASIASDEVEQGRPQPFMIQKAMRLLNCTDPKRVINIGDTPSDLLSGQAAGVGLNLGVVNGTHNRSQLEPYPHDQLLESVRDLHAILSSLSFQALANGHSL
ncbi:HAD family hydrolase [Larkinella terrae]|uniref:HAD hydrolase-like protein n=1 Tax=Larkinella terrae TaxID=2025311 RepID=A0A7K0EGV7_9BACT|nr:HAD hydrolase-like protein [Larkinella terrae]MRS60952.1 HAD hydrolase-like protein [Larkinella terrae]